MKVVERIAQEFNTTQKGVSELLESTYKNNGYASKEASKFLTEVSASNILKFSDETEFYKVDGKIVGMLESYSKVSPSSNTSSSVVFLDDTSMLNVGDLIDVYSEFDCEYIYKQIPISNKTSEYIQWNGALYGYYNRLEGYSYTVRKAKTFDLSQGNDRTGYAGAGDNSFVPHVEVQDQATHGLTVQSAIKKGDYVVVDKEELVTNGTFENSTSGWNVNAGSIATVNGELEFTSTANGDYAYTTISNQIIGKKYTIKLTRRDGTAGARFVVKTGSTFVINDTTTAPSERTDIYTYISEGNTELRVRAFGAGTLYADNISVQLADDIYKATEDIPSGTSLLDSRFETRDFIDSQVLITMDSNGTPYIEPMNVNSYQKDNADTVMTNNSWSKKENGLYTKGDKTVTPIALVNM